LFYSEPIADRILEPLVVAPERHFAAKQLADGRILASDLAAAGDLEAGRAQWLSHVREVANDLLPRLTYVSFSILVTGFYDVTPDNQPVLGTVEGLPGLYLAAGFSGHGFMLAPAVGRRIAEAVVGDLADEALEQFSYARFARGTLQQELVTV
jgi:sarcosine oxidase subunit beta